MISRLKKVARKIGIFWAWQTRVSNHALLNIILEDLTRATKAKSEDHKLEGAVRDMIILYLIQEWELGADADFNRRCVIPLCLTFNRDGRVECTKARFWGERLDGSECIFVTPEPKLEFCREGNNKLSMVGNQGRRGRPSDAEDIEDDFQGNEGNICITLSNTDGKHRWILALDNQTWFKNHELPLPNVTSDNLYVYNHESIWCSWGDVEKRLQFLNSFGDMGKTLTSSSATQCYRHQIGLLVDSSSEIIPCLTAMLSTSKPVIQSLRNATFDSIQTMSFLIKNMNLLSKLPASALPQTNEGWQTVCTILNIFKRIGAQENEILDVLLKEGRKDKWVWKCSKERLIAISDVLDSLLWLEMNLRLLKPFHIHPRVIGINAELFKDHMCFEIVGITSTARLACGGRLSVDALLKFSSAWHAEINAIRQRLDFAIAATTDDNAGKPSLSNWWPSPTGNKEEIMPKGRGRWLLTPENMLEEGREMKHCIASYERHSACAQSHIAALEGTDGTRATAQFSSASRTFTILQIRAKSNGHPSKDCLELAQEIREFLMHQSPERMKILEEDEIRRAFLKKNNETNLNMAVPGQRAALEAEVSLILRLQIDKALAQWQEVKTSEPVQE